jgi:hypothetical protein
MRYNVIWQISPAQENTMTESVNDAAGVEVVDIFADMAVNTAKAVEGVWVPYRGGVEFLVGYTKSRKFREKAASRYRKHSKILESGGKVATDKLDEITLETMAEVTLLGWRRTTAAGVEPTALFNGEVLTYSKENAMKMLALDGFREWVAKQADDLATFKEVQAAEDAKN